MLAMKVWLAAALSALLSVASGERPVDCRWGPYGDWSECDGCSKTQTRTRPVQVFAQFGGLPCSGEPAQTRGCVPTRGCPLDAGCGDRFRCFSGQCINAALVCNGDQDCEEDGFDEQKCEESSSTNVCDDHRVPPNIELTGLGFDVLTGTLRSAVINTKSFGGQCRKVFSGDHRTFYRLPHSLLRYSFQVTVDDDFSDDFYNSSWSYMKHTENKEHFKGGHNYRTFHNQLTSEKAYRLLILRRGVEVAQFQNSPPEYLSLSEEFWKALSALPVTYDSAAYRSLIKKYGTHFLSEGSLGGQYEALLEFEAESMSETSLTHIDYQKCVTKVKRILFWKKTKTTCDKLLQDLKDSKGSSSSRAPVKTDVIGGDPAYVAGLSSLDVENPTANNDMFSKWAGSVKNFPRVIKQKVRPLHELVKEVACASVKKVHLKRALEAYLDEDHTCHCQPCHNNGHAQLRGTTCTCVCPPGTSGPACQHGTVLEGQPGVIHGGWSCWSAWSSCSGGQRSRSRSCINPPPRMGGRHCSGEPSSHQPCEDPELQHLRTMEPHCFDSSLTPATACRTPPPLRNGFVLDPKDVYPVGSKVVYSCIEGHYIIGDAVAECTEEQNWRRQAMECKSTECGAPPLPPDITATPWKLTYQIGEKVSLSCPPGLQREGVSEITCDSSLNWSPSPSNTKCQAMPTAPAEGPGVQCRPWEKRVKDHCVCRMPYECGSSLEVCVMDSERGRAVRLSACKVHALKCLGRSYTMTEDSACDWPRHEATPCTACQLWEKCDERTRVCVCREQGECIEPGALLCAKPGEGAIAVTMTECEAGLRRCRGAHISILSLQPCPE
ncbi:complement component 7b [Megalops cyprinoides]|uniref:complement component 7b n=1 Tax=Megalops cyprinoides TaxID=118141 RepID=UPI0018652498|nr:complement component 7b [Megalops cyprinoides]